MWFCKVVMIPSVFCVLHKYSIRVVAGVLTIAFLSSKTLIKIACSSLIYRVFII
jgi:hypothetical protein